MNCPICGHTNPTYRSTCEECGNDLGDIPDEDEIWEKPKGKAKHEAVTCPNCGHVNPLHQGECENCGASLARKKHFQPPAIQHETGTQEIVLVLGAIGAGIAALVMITQSFLYFLFLLSEAIVMALVSMNLYDMGKRGRDLILVVLATGLVVGFWLPIAGLAVNVLILVWFLTSNNLFRKGKNKRS